MSLAELEELQSLVTSATGPEAVFPALREPSLREEPEAPASGNVDAAVTPRTQAVNDAVEREYVRLSQLASPERYAGDPIAQDTARHILARLYELHQQALDMLGIFESMDSDDSRRAISTTSTRSPA